MAQRVGDAIHVAVGREQQLGDDRCGDRPHEEVEDPARQLRAARPEQGQRESEPHDDDVLGRDLERREAASLDEGLREHAEEHQRHERRCSGSEGRQRDPRMSQAAGHERRREEEGRHREVPRDEPQLGGHVGRVTRERRHAPVRERMQHRHQGHGKRGHAPQRQVTVRRESLRAPAEGEHGGEHHHYRDLADQVEGNVVDLREGAERDAHGHAGSYGRPDPSASPEAALERLRVRPRTQIELIGHLVLSDTEARAKRCRRVSSPTAACVMIPPPPPAERHCRCSPARRRAVA